MLAGVKVTPLVAREDEVRGAEQIAAASAEGVARVLPMRLHLALDLLVGLLLAASPWLLGFADVAFATHLVLGAFEVLVSLATSTSPSQMRVGEPVRRS